MTPVIAAMLEPVDEGDLIALEKVDIQASLRSLFSEVVVTQVYRNLEKSNIEAVYTFPLPLDAVLLDLTLELNGKTLRGVVQPKSEAEERYEHAIEDGDTAILLNQSEPGIFTFHVGNILPDEKAEIRLRYAQIHRWQGDSLRFHLPTTIAPRYGDPMDSGLAPYEVPEHVLSANHGFSLKVRISGELANSNFDCPTHPVAVSSSNGTTEFSLSGGFSQMDRDFVLIVKESADSTLEGLCSKDGEEYVALASFHPTFPDVELKSPRCVKLVVDCSGSMGGNSIVQAKEALRKIISMLKQDDFFNVIKFGSGYELLFSEPAIASDKNINTASKFVEQLDANMGGTEIGEALEATYRCGQIEGLPSDILLITDGQTWGHEELVEKGKKSRHRIFTVGVGSAVSEAFVRSIAESTSGACELVSPRENMSERIVRHFQRIDQPKAQSVQINWPSDGIRQAPSEVETVYAGDTLHVYGWFEKRPVGMVELVLTFEKGQSVTQEVCLSTEIEDNENLLTELPRVAAHARLPELDLKEATDLAVRYQLVTNNTSYVLVFERETDEESVEVPKLQKVPQVLAAGWGGIDDTTCYSMSDASLMKPAPPTDHRARFSMPSVRSKPSYKPMFESFEKLRESKLSYRSFRPFLRDGRFIPEDVLHIQAQTVENAINQLEQFIEQSVQSGYSQLKIIYGESVKSSDEVHLVIEECEEYLESNQFVLAYCNALFEEDDSDTMYILLEKLPQ